MNKELIKFFVLVVLGGGPVFFISSCEKGPGTPAAIVLAGIGRTEFI